MNDLTPSQYPFAGRVSSVIPFLPFTPDERAVIAHKYLLNLVTSMKQPKAIQQSQLIGVINLRFRQETALCRNLASKDYHADTGARSLEAAVKRRVRNAVVRKYLESSQVTHEENTVEDYVVDIGSQGEIVVLDNYMIRHGYNSGRLESLEAWRQYIDAVGCCSRQLRSEKPTDLQHRCNLPDSERHSPLQQTNTA